MNQIIAIALGGACGAVVRFLVSSGLYQWLGRGFPYGTLAVNVIGSLLMGILAEALIVQRIAIGLEYRAAILVGFIGAFTTFSTFALETVYLLEQGNLARAGLNVIVSVSACLLAVWLGLLCGRGLFHYANGVLHWSGVVIPYALMLVNAIGAFLIGIVAAILLHKVAIAMEYRATLMVIMIGSYLTLSGLYLILSVLEQGVAVNSSFNLMLGLLISNGVLCSVVMWLGLALAKHWV
jgi:CrcB protein